MRLFLLLGIIGFSIIGKAQNGFTFRTTTLTGSAGVYINATSICVDANNNVWTGYKNTSGSAKRLIKFYNETWTDYSTQLTSPVLSIAADASGNIWIGTLNGGLVKFDGTNFTSFTKANSGIVSDTITSIEVINNMIYAGSNVGLSVFDGASTFTNYNSANSGLGNNNVYSFAQDGSNVFIGTAAGLYKFNSGTISYTGSIDQINDIMVDASGNKWLATDTSGLVRYDNSSFTRLSTLIPNPFGSTLPSRMISIGKSPAGNPIINTNVLAAPASTMLYTKQLMEIFPNNDYQYYYFPSSAPSFSYDILMANGNNTLYFCNSKLTSPPTNTLSKRFPNSLDFVGYHSNNVLDKVTKENTQYLDINYVKAGFNPSADMHWDGNTGALYEVPKGSGRTATMSSNLWIGGYANNGLRIAAGDYRTSGVDFWPGYIDSVSGLTDSIIAENYNRVWKVNRYDIEDFKYNFLMGNVQNGTYQIPADILAWPGNNSFYQQQLAPYIDYNGDFAYDPQDGDYPLIKGDQMLWWVFNDALGAHNITGSAQNMNIEVHASAYAYFCPTIADSDKVINYTTFYNYKIINRGNETLDSVRIGIRGDVDLGYYKDDYIGCDVTNNLAYVFNGDNYDEDYGSVLGYGYDLPMFAYSMLRGPAADLGNGKDDDRDGCIDCTWPKDANGNPMTGGTYYDEYTVRECTSMDAFLFYNNDFNTRTGNPQPTGGGIQYYNLLTSHWLDNNGNTDPITYGDYGTSPQDVTHPIAKFMFPGDSDPFGYGMGGSPANPVPSPLWYSWTENNVTGDQPGDRRLLSSFDNFTLYPGEWAECDFACVFTQTNDSNNFSALSKGIADNLKVRKWFINDNAPSCLDLSTIGLKENNKTLNMLVYPNPATSNLTIDAGDNNTITGVKVYNILGALVMEHRSINQSKTSIGINNLQPAVYLIEVSSINGTYFTRFVKE